MRRFAVWFAGGALAALLGCSSPYDRAAPRPEPPPPGLSEAYRHAAPGEEFQTNDFGRVGESPFVSPLDEPLSTFSIDVDTAFYSIVRRLLREGTLPPGPSVRIEELVNYFRYDYPEPDGEHPFSVTTDLAECPWGEGTLLLRIGLRSPAVAVEDLPPANLVFLIDVSGSMNHPNRLPLARKAFRLLADRLRPQDRVAIVVYAGSAGLVLPTASGADKRAIAEALEGLQAGGSTAGGEGIRLAYSVARQNFVPGGVNRIVLATDGDFNIGASSEAELVEMVERERASGVELSVLGFGLGNLKDSRIEQLADNGNGGYAYIDSILEARRALVEQMGATLPTVAKDVKIQVEFNPARVAEYRLIGYENRRLRSRDFDDDAKDAGDLGAGHAVTAFYEIRPAGAAGESGQRLKYQRTTVVDDVLRSAEWATVKLRYKPAGQDESRLLVRAVAGEPAALEAAPADFRFAAAVAGFGYLLRASPQGQQGDFDRVVELADSSKGADPDGSRSEFVFLARTAQSLMRAQQAQPSEAAGR